MSGRQQYAALPFVTTVDSIEICLITSKETGRWIIPKGWPKKGMAPHELAALEAFEEAGLKGSPDPRAIGCFHYSKRLDDGSEVECEVSVFPMLVEYQAINWPEQEQRTAIWVHLEEAVRLVNDIELSHLLRRFGPKSPPSKSATEVD
jgi:8-oxo-dGTP pyrophosphatase MutT (NUDIX family)